jgi:hypothetical protein
MSSFSDPPETSQSKATLPFQVRDRWHWDRAQYWPWLFTVVALLLLCRQPDAIIHPTLYAEDGKILFKQQYEMGLLPALTTRYAGYPLITPRIIAALSSYLPLEIIPLFYAIISLLIAAGTLTFFCAIGFRSVIRSDSLRVGIVLLFALMPNVEGLMKLAYINWYMLFFTALIALFNLPQNRAIRWSLLIPVVIAAWSNPVAIVCLPVFLLRAWQAPNGDERGWWLAVVLASSLFPFMANASPSMVTQLEDWKLALIHAVGYRVFCFFVFGSTLSYPFPTEGWMLVTIISFFWGAIFGVGVAVATRNRKGLAYERSIPIVLFYLILALPDLFVLRKEWLHFFWIGTLSPGGAATVIFFVRAFYCVF